MLGLQGSGKKEEDKDDDVKGLLAHHQYHPLAPPCLVARVCVCVC